MSYECFEVSLAADLQRTLPKSDGPLGTSDV